MSNFETYTDAVASLTDEQLGDEICSKQAIQMRVRSDSADWDRASTVLAVFFAEAQRRSARGAIIRSL